jgi:methylmalonyl-CoA mutase C-terminal domain/subunit
MIHMKKITKIRILMTKAGLDGHDRGLKVVSTLLRDNGFEVINLGCYQTALAIVSAAEQEDVDIIGLSVLGDEYRVYVPRVKNLLKEKGLDHIVFIVGGTIPPDEIEEIKKMGADAVFLPGTLIGSIVEDLRSLTKERRRS